MEMFEKVERVIMDEYHKIQNTDNFIDAIGIDGMSYIKEYVTGFTDKVLLDDYTDNDYIKEYLTDMVRCELLNGGLKEAKVYMDILYSLFKDY